MMSPREFYKQQHPGQFSDSQNPEVTELDREVIEFALSSVTTNNQEQQFERFCLRVCETRICPNLIPNTGPAGGGDGKVDADTFPIADSTVSNLYEGIGRRATKERWAFAFSAYKNWKVKVTRDVKSICSTERPYKEILFVTNQAVPSKQRQQTQDELSAKYDIRLTILDRTWLLDSIIEHDCARFATEELGLKSASKFVPCKGPRDITRRKRLNELESWMRTEQEKGPSFLAVENSLLAAKIARTLEDPLSTVERLFEQARSSAKQFGTDAQRIEVEYELGWTTYWWYEDFVKFLDCYARFIDALGDVPTFDSLSRWRNLWMIAPTAIAETGSDPEVLRTDFLLEAIERAISNPDADSATKTNAKFLKNQIEIVTSLRSGVIPDSKFEDLLEELACAERTFGFDFEGFIHWIEIIGKTIPSVASFEALYDAVTEMQATRVGEIKAARMQLERAEALIQANDVKKACARLSQARLRLFKHETRTECIYCLFLLGNMYLRLGLTWAARATLITSASIGLQYLLNDNRLHPGLRTSVSLLRLCAIDLGFMGESLTWHDSTRKMQAITYDRTGDSGSNSDEESQYEILLGRLILRIPGDSRHGLETLPAILEELGLYLAADLTRVKLGAPLSIINDDMRISPEAMLSRIYNMQVDMLRLTDAPADIPAEPKGLSTKLFGCTFLIEYESPEKSRPLAEVLVTLIEPVFATATPKDVFAFQERVIIRLVCSDSHDSEVNISRLVSDVRADFEIVHGANVTSTLSCCPDSLAHRLVECAVRIGYGSLFTDLSTIEAKSTLDGLYERSFGICSLVSEVKFLVGCLEAFSLSTELAHGEVAFPISSEKWNASSEIFDVASIEEKCVQSSLSEASLERTMSSASHSQMTVVSPIRGGLWDAAGWFGVLYMWSPYEQSPPVMAIGVENLDAGEAIVSGWLETYGGKAAEVLRISIIRGVSKKNPHCYRVLISGRIPEDSGGGLTKGPQLIQMAYRIQTMIPSSSENLERFLGLFEFHRKFYLTFHGKEQNAADHLSDFGSTKILMRELVVRNAWEIGRHDLDGVGILLDDDVDVPDGVKDAPVLELLEWKRQLHSADHTL